MAVRSCQIGSFYSPTKKNLKTGTTTHHEAIQSLRRHTDRTSDIPERFMVQIQFRNTQTNVIRITHTQKNPPDRGSTSRSPWVSSDAWGFFYCKKEVKPCTHFETSVNRKTVQIGTVEFVHYFDFA